MPRMMAVPRSQSRWIGASHDNVAYPIYIFSVWKAIAYIGVERLQKAALGRRTDHSILGIRNQ